MSYAKRLFDLSKKAGLLSGENLSDVFPENKLQKLSREIAKDKKSFLSNNQDLTDPEKLWNEGIRFRITEKTTQLFIDYLQKKNKAMMINWDQPVEDIVYNFKKISSDLDISDTGEKQVDGKWFQGLKIGTEIFEYESTKEGYVRDVLCEINKHLLPKSKVIVCPTIGDENQYILINNKYLSDFEKLGFFEP